MSVIPLVKVTLYGPTAEKESVLDGLQRLGCLHLNDLHPSDATTSEPPSTATDARAALEFLRDSPMRRQPTRRKEDVDVREIVKQTIEVRDQSRALSEEREQLRKWIADLEPWGDFEVPPWMVEGPLRLWFYVVPLQMMTGFASIDLPWRVVARDHRFSYVAVISADQPAGLPGVPAFLQPRSLSALRSLLEEVERSLEDFEYRRVGLTLYRRILADALDEADDRAARAWAAGRMLEKDRLFAVQGWAPRERVRDLREFAAHRRLAITLESPGPSEAPPTLLRNPEALRGGEGLVTFYKTPGYNMPDPSRAVFFAFAIFFGMIFSDAGYGFVLGIILLALWGRLGRSGSGLRAIMVALVISSVIYGVLIGSYFGVTPSRGSWLASLRILDPAEQNPMMLLAVGVGAAHLGYANIVTAWARRRSLRSLSALGWTGIICGGFCLGLGKSFPALARLSDLGWAALLLGGLLVLLFTSERPFGLTPKALLGRLIDGLMGTTELSKAFGDLLSYLRLFALGLASIKLAEAFNHLAASSFEIGGAGMLLGVLLIVVGHSINFTMGIMGGVVHGLRLNVIEFFNWSLPEEGELFRAFAKKARG
jgi:V/A-type H+/Na+-transporting ATPase subunit I